MDCILLENALSSKPTMDQVDFTGLPKKERKRLKREMEQQKKVVQAKKSGMMKWFVIAIVLVLLGIAGWWIVQGLSKPLPGQQFPDQGRDHVAKDEWEKFAYNSNPPTSGPHDVEWTKTGVYDQPQGDGHLVHSLEHGYVVISYNCGNNQSASSPATADNQPSVQPTTITQLSQQECDSLKKQLSDLANEKKLWKLVVVPRPNLDRQLAVASWTWLEKLDGLDKEKIVVFIDAHRNHGPEQTME